VRYQLLKKPRQRQSPKRKRIMTRKRKTMRATSPMMAQASAKVGGVGKPKATRKMTMPQIPTPRRSEVGHRR